MGLRLTVLLCMIAVISVPQLLRAEDNDLFVVPLEELTNMNYIVQTASKRDESISDAPGIVTVITADDIVRFGAQKLSDVLSRFPNMYMWGSEVLHNNVASIRGQTPTQLDNHILILLNGRPMRESLGGINLNIYESFPIDAIEHIEMVRGPSSVLYGSNAFSGVINIVTKSVKDIPKNQVTLGGGSFTTRMASALGAVEIKDFSTVAALNGRDVDGWDIPFVDANRVRGGYEHGENMYGGFMQTTYKDLKLNAFASNVKTDRLGAMVRFPAAANSTVNQRQRQFLDAGYRYDLSENWATTVNATLNNYYQDAVGIGAEGRLLEMGLSGTLGEKITLFTGATIDNHYVETVTARLALYDDVTWYGYYAQADYALSNWAKLTCGFQLNKPEDIDYDIVPRLGVVMHFTPAWGAKILYGEAFRSPYGGERIANVGYLVGNPTLEPETMNTIDAQLFYNESRISSAFTVYKSMQKKSITRVNTVPITNVNAGNIEYMGIEWEGRTKMAEHWELIGTISHQMGEDDAGNNEIGLVPHTMAKLGISYSSGTGYQIGVFDSYYSDAAKIEKISNAVIVNPAAHSYHWLTVNASLDLDKFMGTPVILNLYGENMLDNVVYFPEAFTREVNTTPMRSGRAAYARVTVKF